METFYVISRNHFEVKWGIVGTLVNSSEENWKEKHYEKTSVWV